MDPKRVGIIMTYASDGCSWRSSTPASGCLVDIVLACGGGAPQLPSCFMLIMKEPSDFCPVGARPED